MDFPTSIRFSVDLQSSKTIEKVLLYYGTTQDTCGKVSAIAFPEIKPGKKVAAEWEWDMRQSGGEPPGATIWWQWEVVDDQGASELTERKEVTWIDDVHHWKLIDKGMIRLHHYYLNKSTGEALAEAGVAALAYLKKDIGMVPEEPIDIFIYDSNEDLSEAVFYEPDWMGGQAYSDYNILIIGVETNNLDWGKGTIAHELTHILEGDYSFSCLGNSPTWLVEGLAMYGEGGPDTYEKGLFEQNLDDNTLFSFAVLSGGFSEDPEKAELSYCQSYYMVNYLIEKYGQAKMLEFLGMLSAAGGLDESLQQVYGFDLTGFENEWRASLSLSPLEVGAVQSAPQPTFIPTLIPIQGVQSQPVGTSQSTSSTETTSIAPTGESGTQTSPGFSQDTFMQRLIDILPKVLLWMLIIGVASLVLIGIILFVVIRKGGQK